jgi:glycine/D-amino acid oxidase-like deaminating enzyme
MAQGNTINCDIAVIGGGILGLAIAALAAQKGYEVRVFRLNDQDRPCADTLRNQGWLQSGLMYIDRFGADRARGRTLSRQMYFAGRRMLVDLELPLPTEADRGIIRLNSEEEAALLEEDARYLRIAGVQRLDTTFVQRRLGDIYEDGIFYSIPDAPFPEAMVLTKLREIAQQQRADLIQSTTPARLISDINSESGARVECQIDGKNYQILSKATIAAAGAGNWPLLHGLGIDPAMTLRQTPLLVLHETFFTDVPIFADRMRKFSFVRHPPDGELLPEGALVIGTKVHREVAFKPPDSRRIEPEDREEFETYLPSILKEKISSGRFTAGYEVIPDKKLELKDIEPWVEWVEGFPAVLKAVPGRATMGMFVARQILDEITSRIGVPDTTRSPYSRIGMPWDGEIFMHYHPNYSFNDSE